LQSQDSEPSGASLSAAAGGGGGATASGAAGTGTGFGKGSGGCGKGNDGGLMGNGCASGGVTVGTVGETGGGRTGSATCAFAAHENRPAAIARNIANLMAPSCALSSADIIGTSQQMVSKKTASNAGHSQS
jgi:hypothetical protein